ncbi:hypothetical protein BZA05DRAFT_477912 [Tricharina praecox]|uniref:uncharacterized protein n=1 Tax=Tricharina praecox TaxID=43433 RepID=UPI002220C3EE|nr:uncharacterized protein BZA05DRAFT_477912 [Tricharina praecox]KAI5840945.1 hypothetical protein BZA05DRAFT_477912 [Tricharina praecox]
MQSTPFFPQHALDGVPDHKIHGRLHPAIVGLLTAACMLSLFVAIFFVVRRGMRSVKEHDENARIDRERMASIKAVGGLDRIYELANQGDTRMLNEFVLSKAQRENAGVQRTFKAITVVAADGKMVTVQHPVRRDLKAEEEAQKLVRKASKKSGSHPSLTKG